MKKRASQIALLVAASFLALAGTAAQAETRLSFTTGVDYSSGAYGGTDTTEVIAVPFGVRLTVDDWTFRASSSYLDITGPADVSEDGEPGESAGTVGARRLGTRPGRYHRLDRTRVSSDRWVEHIC